MVSRRNGEFKRTVLSALAALVAAAVPSLISSAALAETPAGHDAASSEAAKAPAKHDAKKPRKAHAGKAHKPHAKAENKADASKAPEAKDAKDGKGKTAATAKGKKTKKTAARAVAGRKKGPKKADSEAPGRPCVVPPVTLDRMGLEGQSFSLVDCKGTPLDSAQLELSLLARPWGVARPLLPTAPAKKPPAKGKPASVPLPSAPPGVRLVDKGLLTRLEAITRRFPGKTISLVSGYRPQSKGSQHQAARALDVRVAGVSNEALVAFCKTLPDTGCGYYPNSSFIHVDVRNPGTGVVEWIDASGPGEAPRYVQQWPEPAIEPVAKLPPQDDQALLVHDHTDTGGDDDDHGETMDDESHAAPAPALKAPLPDDKATGAPPKDAPPKDAAKDDKPAAG